MKFEMSLNNDLLFQLKATLESFSGSGGKLAPVTSQAVGWAADYVQHTWQHWAVGENIDGMTNCKFPDTRLAQSIRVDRTSDFSVTIGSDSPKMQSIADGQKEYDMKNDAYLRGKKARVTKDNVPYLIVPFRWGTPHSGGIGRAHFGNTVPPMIYQFLKAKQSAQSVRTKQIYITENIDGVKTERNKIEWGTRVTADGLANGMVKMQGLNGKSQYFTFRIISAKSAPSAWIRKAVPGYDVVSDLQNVTRTKVEEIIEAGLRADFAF